MVQICGSAPPPPPRGGGTVTLRPLEVARQKGGDFRGGGVSDQEIKCVHLGANCALTPLICRAFLYLQGCRHPFAGHLPLGCHSCGDILSQNDLADKDHNLHSSFAEFCSHRIETRCRRCPNEDALLVERVLLITEASVIGIGVIGGSLTQLFSLQLLNCFPSKRER